VLSNHHALLQYSSIASCFAAAAAAPQVDGDKLQGRGVTDCLGHVALLTELFRQLAVVKPKLRPTVLGCFIANEENATVRAAGGCCLTPQRWPGNALLFRLMPVPGCRCSRACIILLAQLL
jgi:hypothetical protein